MAPQQWTFAILSKFRTQARAFITSTALQNWRSSYVSPVCDVQNQCSSFSSHLSQKFPFPNGSLMSVWIPNFQRSYSSKTGVNVVDTDENKITIGPQKSAETERDNHVVYYGPISETIRRVKLLSLSTCCLSVSLGPAVTFLTSPDMNVILKGAIASSVIFISASTTGTLHWFASPYVHKLKWQPGSDSFEVEMLSWLATYVPRTIQFSDVKPAETNRPYVTFEAKGNYYFIDADRFPNKALLAKLTPKRPTRTLKNL
ncbi:hypothetical protein SUGI_0600230 [Cryptomeria japonica]|uniref:uncharacterized protein LOC131035129 n=1 Tax=Cryptomeria japonica TaxID=3369 RepID=UPI00241482E1|nr:uncharacterized protein LOC131035129 [Cryptomeria japonica]GLJ30339.1 hypothetical protein SUGI_0600230 [Cryptomeria japonica]